MTFGKPTDCDRCGGADIVEADGGLWKCRTCFWVDEPDEIAPTECLELGGDGCGGTDLVWDGEDDENCWDCGFCHISIPVWEAIEWSEGKFDGRG